MSALLNELQRIVGDLHSDKAPARNKAIEQLDQKLNCNRTELHKLLSRNNELSWNDVFNTVKEAIFKHGNNLRDASSERAIKLLADKCYLYGNALDHIIDYNLEMGRTASGHFLSKSIIIEAFVSGTKQSIIIRHFGVHFISLMDRGVFLSSKYISQLKVSEYSNILSILFELNVDNDEFLRSKIIKCIIKIVKYAKQRTQLHDDLMEYLPTLENYAQCAQTADRKQDIVRLYHLFINELAVNYHQVLCVQMQKIIPKLCDFYNDDVFCDETRKIFFESVEFSLHTLYPKLYRHDFTTYHFGLDDDWEKCIFKLRTIIHMEIRKHTQGRSRPSVLNTDKFSPAFLQMSALVVYIVMWYIEPLLALEEQERDPSKRIKLDLMQPLIDLIDLQETSFNAVWFAIFTELLKVTISIMREDNNFQDVRKTTLHVLKIYGNAVNLRNVRYCIMSILSRDQSPKLLPMQETVDFCEQVATHLLADTLNSADVIEEKQIILQYLIKYDKLSPKTYASVLQTITTNDVLRRNECILTIRELFIHADQCGIDKASDIMEPVIKWAYDHENSNAIQIINNIEPINQPYLADTFAIGIINFLDEDQLQRFDSTERKSIIYTVDKTNRDLLEYKYNKKLICLDDEFQSQLRGNKDELCESSASMKCGLFQNNYELLMRMLDPTPKTDSNISDMTTNLKSLHKLVCTMERLLFYNVFDKSNYRQCPLIKRIGFFFSRNELMFMELKTQVNDIDECDLHDMLDKQIDVLNSINKNAVLMRYLEQQPVEVLIEFIGVVLQHSTQKKYTKATDGLKISTQCFCILGNMCAIQTYSHEAFSVIASHLNDDITDIRTVFLMLCRCKNLPTNNSMEWLSEKLKAVFQRFNTQVNVMDQVVDCIPTIASFFHKTEHLLDVIMIAMNSLMKLAFSKSYPAPLAAKIVRCVAEIAKTCPNIYHLENFVVICKSVVTFLAIPTLEVRFATIETLTLLLNANFCGCNTGCDDEIANSKAHQSFCEQLYNAIDFNKLRTTDIDMLANTHSVTLQSLVAFFAFSTFHQESSLHDLLTYCASHHKALDTDDFIALNAFVPGHNLTMRDLILPHMDSMLHKWISMRLHALKFPFYMCYNSKEEYIEANSKSIITYTYIYRTPEEIHRCKLLVQEPDVSFKLKAYFLLESETPGEDDIIERHQENLTKNLQQFDMFPLNVPPNEETLHEMVEHLHDPDELNRLFNGTLMDNRKRLWFNRSVDDLFAAMSKYVHVNKIWSMNVRDQAMSVLMFERKLILIELLGKLKTSCYRAELSLQECHSFFAYCSIADAILNAANAAIESTETDEDLIHINVSYFVHDIWFFICRFPLHSKSEQLQRAALEYIQQMIDICKFPMLNDNTQHLDEIGQLLFACMQHVKSGNLKTLATGVLKKFINKYKTKLNIQSLLDGVMEADNEPNHLELLHDLCVINVQVPSVVGYIRTFLKHNQIERLQGLREHIAKHKEELQNHEKLLFKLINRLIHLVRESPKEASSLEAVKCLAEIGPLKMRSNMYYFKNEFDDIHELESSERPIVQFLHVIMKSLETHLYDFNTQTHAAIVQVIGHVVNNKDAIDLLDEYQHLRIFHTKLDKVGYLSRYGSISFLDWTTCLQSSDDLDYEAWICKFMSLVFGECRWYGFDALAANSFAFAKDCMQSFFKLLLTKQGLQLDSLCQMVDYFFTQTANNAEGIYQDNRVIKQFLYICECIRLANSWRIPINLANVVQASNQCQAYFLSVMYLELWASSAKENNPNLKILADENFQMCAKTAYTAIGCLDAIPCFLDPLQSRVDYFSLNNNVSGMLLSSDKLDETKRQMCVDVMKSNGMLTLADLYQRKSVSVDHEILWRLSQWDEPIDGYQKVDRDNNMEIEFKKHHYMALKSISKREEDSSLLAIDNAYQCVQAILRDISVECLQSVNKYMTWLCMLQQSEDFCQIQFSTKMSPQQNEALFKKLRVELGLCYGNFKCKEQILAHQITLFKMPGTRAERRIKQYFLEYPLETYLIKCIDECKAAGQLNLATKYIDMLRALPDIRAPTKVSALLQDADVNLKTGNYQIAKAILLHVNTSNEFKFCVERVPALRMQAELLLSSNAESFAKALQTFKDSLQMLEHFKLRKADLIKMKQITIDWNNFEKFEHENKLAAHAAIAKYADREYQKLHDYRQSQEYKTLVDMIQQNRSLANTVPMNRNTVDRDRLIGVRNLKSFANLDENELKTIENNLTQCLCTAMEHYTTYCQMDKGFSTPEIYRIIALWFTNDQNAQMLDTIKDAIQLIPSYKFIGVVNQLAGRLNTRNGAFHTILVDLLVRCGKDHPQQTFYKLYPLVYAHMDGAYANTQRAAIAKEIIARSCAENAAALKASKQFELMFPALIKFANSYLGPNNKVDTNAVTAMLKDLNRLKLDLVQCPTIELPVQPSKEYNIISIVKWTGEFEACGGLNAPLKLMCLCSDGVERAQLIKGKDDLRQDAVMQQVFGIVNELFNSDSEFVERKLQLRTYKVTPLSTRCGIIEWVSNTVPIGTYLAGNGTAGAHMKYRPHDWNNNKCRTMLAAAAKKPAEERRKVYQKICEQVKPVFQYFLLEKFPIPGEWFERRLAYINSVATTSIVGYVLGLGDRHTQNILIDTQTAEVVHIDFGIAFEQGKIQATPETVPFRLTRDMVAPMGVCGTNGVFTKSCEATMHILRRYKSVLITILEVLLYDPLFIWGVLSKNQQQDQSNNESKNLLAQRALLLVKNKLEGKETGLIESSDVKTQVQRLINEATLPSNLALLFHGWDPYL